MCRPQLVLLLSDWIHSILISSTKKNVAPQIPTQRYHGIKGISRMCLGQLGRHSNASEIDIGDLRPPLGVIIVRRLNSHQIKQWMVRIKSCSDIYLTLVM